VQHNFSCHKQKILLPTLCLSLFLSLPTSFAADSPSETVKLFYQLISQQKCQEAIKLRPDYSLKRCEKISKTHVHKATTELSDANNAVLLLELDSFVSDKKNYFFGYVKLTKKKGKWLIVGPFKNRDDYWLDEYISEYIPEGIKGLSAKERTKKLISPPIEEIATEKVTKKTPNKKPKDTPTDSPTKPKTQVAIKKESRIAPPGDSIDADEFKDKTNKSKKALTSVSSIEKTIKNNSANSTVSQASTPDADKFLLGEHAIEGNYTSLLKQIRKNFPTEASANILLIDQSRNTIYVYNNTNLLLAFFPILSSDNSNFPSGLYRLIPEQVAGLENNKIPLDNQPIILERMQILLTAKNDIPPQKMKNSEHYFIRDLFDTDKDKSLLLSPIDSSKLQHLILPSAIAYKGQ